MTFNVKSIFYPAPHDLWLRWVLEYKVIKGIYQLSLIYLFVAILLLVGTGKLAVYIFSISLLI